MIVGYECNHCKRKFKCTKTVRQCPFCGYWFDKIGSVPVLTQHNEEAFLNDPNIHVIECDDSDSYMQKMQDIREKKDRYHDIGSIFGKLR